MTAYEHPMTAQEHPMMAKQYPMTVHEHLVSEGDRRQRQNPPHSLSRLTMKPQQENYTRVSLLISPPQPDSVSMSAMTVTVPIK